ncbi:MAG: hydantoinase/oxoprolinase family protein [Betaproteobacteria bacterium]|nr:hydantoinase/oxoprolinase family protein [Betaproteobacteria bacterium]
MEQTKEAAYIVSCDAGGTMTDLFVVNPDGEFVVGKAATTPHQESIGYRESLEDAFTYWDIDLKKQAKQVIPNVIRAVYTGTAMLNAMIIRSGAKVGLIVNKGFEQTLMQTRAKEIVLGYGRTEVFHAVYRRRKEPYVPYRQIRGVTGRIDLRGNEVIPLYEHEARAAVEELLDEGVECLAICFMGSFANPVHEKRMAEIAKEILKKTGKDLPVLTSHEVSPYSKEVSRMNTLVVQAYAAESGRRQLLDIEKDLKNDGYKYPLQMVLAYGTVADIRWPRIVEATTSGPVGAIIGTKFLGDQIGEKNWVCSDVGGTSFDVGMVLNGRIALNREPEFQRMYLTVPMLDVRSIGAGAGTYIRLDENTNRIKLGPDSASGTPGPVAYDHGNLTPTIADCSILLGRLNPDNYLGGKVKLNVELSRRIFKEKIADPLGLDMYQAAEEIVDLLDVSMRQHVASVVSGYDPKDFVLIGFGGAGGLHLARYAGDLSAWKGVCTVPWAAGFSAFGCAAMDHAHRYGASRDLMLPNNPTEAARREVAEALNASWNAQAKDAIREFAGEGVSEEKLKFVPYVLMKYFGQIMDLEVTSPTGWLDSPADVSKLIAEFERVYRETYTQVGVAQGTPYQITRVGLVATADSRKPAIKKYKLEGKEPPEKARKPTRETFCYGEWMPTEIFDLDEIRPGNKIKGIAILEGPAYTLFIPPDTEVEMDQHKVIWLRKS